MYRPDGWKNPHILNSPVESIMGSIREDACHHAYEAGADAILKSLRESGHHFSWNKKALKVSIPNPFRNSFNGRVVFIPEE